MTGRPRPHSRQGGPVPTARLVDVPLVALAALDVWWRR